MAQTIRKDFAAKITPIDNAAAPLADTRPNILIVDDRKENLLATEKVLKKLDAGIFKANSGVPFTPNFGAGGDPAGVLGSDATFLTPNRKIGGECNTLVNPGSPNNYIKAQCFAIPTAPSAAFYTANCDPNKGKGPASLECYNLFGNAGRNILIGPGLVNLDFSVFKNNYIRKISENFNIQFRWEIFNILNRANFAVPSSAAIFDAAGVDVSANDIITSTQTPSRQM